jgi:polysaccharide biosynthesis transport protein
MTSNTFSLRFLFRIIFNHFGLIIISLIVINALIIFRNMIAPEIYISDTRLYVERVADDVAMVSQGRPFAAPPSTDQVLNTESEIIRSFPVLESALCQTLNTDSVQTQIVLGAAKALQIISVTKSSILDIQFRHSDPEYATTLLNNLVIAYRDMRSDVDNQSYITSLFEQQQQRLRQQIDSLHLLQKTLLEEQSIPEINGAISNLGLRLLELEGKIFSLRSHQLDLENEKHFLQQQLSSFRDDDITLPFIPVEWRDAQNLLDQYITAINQLRNLRTQYAETYVEVIRQQRQVDKMREMLISMFDVHLDQVTRQIDDTREQISLYQNEIENNRQILQPLPHLKSIWDNTTQTLANLNGLYDELTRQQLAKEINTHPTGNVNISLIAPAIAPLSPTYPRRGANIFLGFIGSLVFIIALVYLLDTMNRTIKYGEDLENNHIPYLAGFIYIKE